MNDSNLNQDDPANVTRAEIMSALFANMVVQQGNLALMMLGKIPHPQSGQTMQDLEAARMFIDQLEMLEAKTKGNLSKEEEQLLKQMLTTVRLAFVEEIEKQPSDQSRTEPSPAQTSGAVETAAPPASETPASSATPPDAESRKKFTKKY